MGSKYDQHPLEKNYHFWDRSNVEQALRAKEFSADLLRVAKRTYRKHVCDDDSIGWDELGDELCDILCNVMGDDEFNKIYRGK